MPSVRFAFIGPAHEASPWLLRSLARLGTLEAVCDENADGHAGAVPARWTFTRVADLLQEAEPDGVVLQVPVDDRPRLAKECLTKGAGVLILGAPGAASACRRLESVAKLSGQNLFAAPAIRFSPAMMLARRLVDSGKLGAPISVSVQSDRASPGGAGGSVLAAIPLDQVFEAVDLVHHLIGPLQSVHSVGHPDGVLLATGVTAGGVPVSLVFHSRARPELAGLELEIRATDGTRLRIDRNLQVTCGNGSRVDATHGCTLSAADPGLELGYDGLVAEFRRGLQGRDAVRGGLAEAAWRVTIASEAVLMGVGKGRLIEIRYPEEVKS